MVHLEAQETTCWRRSFWIWHKRKKKDLLVYWLCLANTSDRPEEKNDTSTSIKSPLHHWHGVSSFAIHAATRLVPATGESIPITSYQTTFPGTSKQQARTSKAIFSEINTNVSTDLLMEPSQWLFKFQTTTWDTPRRLLPWILLPNSIRVLWRIPDSVSNTSARSSRRNWTSKNSVTILLVLWLKTICRLQNRRWLS